MAGDHSDASRRSGAEAGTSGAGCRFVIVAGSASPLAGKSYPAGREQTIGRDGSRCDIVFPVETKGVSASIVRYLLPKKGSCSVIWDLLMGRFWQMAQKWSRDKRGCSAWETPFIWAEKTIVLR